MDFLANCVRSMVGFRMDASTSDLDIASLFQVAETMFIGPQLLSGCMLRTDLHPRHKSKRHRQIETQILFLAKNVWRDKKGS